jgi:hypothetical protein
MVLTVWRPISMLIKQLQVCELGPSALSLVPYEWGTYITNFPSLPSPSHSLQLLLWPIIYSFHLVQHKIPNDRCSDSSRLFILVRQLGNYRLSFSPIFEYDQKVPLIRKVQLKSTQLKASATPSNVILRNTHATSRNRKARLLFSTISLYDLVPLQLLPQKEISPTYHL